MREIIKCIITCLVIIAWGFAIRGTVEAHTYDQPQKPVSTYYEIVEIPEPEPVVIPATPIIRTSTYRAFSQRECDLLERIARAEAGNQGVEGMALVMNVVINRADKGSSIESVIYAPHQFYTAGMPGTGNDESGEALLMIMNGWDESRGALYFCSTGWNQYGEEHLFQYKDHWFSK